MNTADKGAHAQRMLDHLGNQWPIAAPTQRTANRAELDLALMLRRANNHLASLALVDGISPEIKRTAAAFLNESRGLLRRTGHDR